MGEGLPKQFRVLGSEPILAHTINRFHKALPDAQLIVVLPAHLIDFWHNLAARFEVARHTVVKGGEERFHSVKNVLSAVGFDVEIVGVQDAVRPLASVELIRRTVEEAAVYGSAIPVVEAVDSYRAVEGEESHIIDRTPLRIVQTPQIFAAPILRAAYDTEFRAEFTDDASVVEFSGENISLCEGDYLNIKITTPNDISLANAIVAMEKENKEDK